MVDIAEEIIQTELSKLGGEIISTGITEQQFNATFKCFIELKLSLGKDFSGAIVFQDDEYFTLFNNHISIKDFVALGGFKVIDLRDIKQKKLVKSLDKTNILFSLTLEVLKDLEVQATYMKKDLQDSKGLITLWQARPVILLLHNPQQLNRVWRKSFGSCKKACCISFNSLMGLLGFLWTGKQAQIDDARIEDI